MRTRETNIGVLEEVSSRPVFPKVSSVKISSLPYDPRKGKEKRVTWSEISFWKDVSYKFVLHIRQQRNVFHCFLINISQTHWRPNILLNMLTLHWTRNFEKRVPKYIREKMQNRLTGIIIHWTNEWKDDAICLSLVNSYK